MAALSASPGKLKPWTQSLDPLATFEELSFANAVAWMAAFCAPARNLSKKAMVVDEEQLEAVPQHMDDVTFSWHLPTPQCGLQLIPMARAFSVGYSCEIAGLPCRICKYPSISQTGKAYYILRILGIYVRHWHRRQANMFYIIVRVHI